MDEPILLPRNPSSRLAGKIVLVTGGSRGIGQAIVLKLAQQGANVAINYVRHHGSARATQREVEKYGAEVTLVKADVTQEEQVVAMIRTVRAHFGRLDILVNNADDDRFELKDPLKIKTQNWHLILRGSLMTVVHGCKHALKLMRAQGSGIIVNIAAAGGPLVDVASLCVPYYIAKEGVTTLTRVLATQEAKNNIRINSVSPAFVDNYDYPSSLRSKLLARIPMRRFAQTTEVADAVAFLVSEEAKYMTGVNLIVGGGYG